nr:GNAT family N-acetyltransferase [Kineococcus vitellinus]
MTTPLADALAPAAPAGYRVAADTRGATTVLTVHAADGTPAARGHLAVAGADAVLDRISTEEQHRRRGLGTVVVTHLAAAARAGGARRGVLVASAQGRALYASLGWRTRSPITGAHRHLGTGAGPRGAGTAGSRR